MVPPPAQNFPLTSQDWTNAFDAMSAGLSTDLAILPQDSLYRDTIAFHMSAFETVFAKPYDPTATAYFFDQALDSSTVAQTIPGHNSIGDLCDVTVLTSIDIDISTAANNPSGGVLMKSMNFVVGVLDSIGSQSFYGVSYTYDYTDGITYNDLFLLGAVDDAAIQALLIGRGLLVPTYSFAPGVDGNSASTCAALCQITFQNCIANADATLLACHDLVDLRILGCAITCLIAAAAPGLGTTIAAFCLLACAADGIIGHRTCSRVYALDLTLCGNNLNACLLACGIVVVYI